MSTIKKNVFSPGLFIAFLVGTIMLLYGNWDYIKCGRFSDYIKVTDKVSFFSMSYLLSGIYLFMPVMAVLPGTAGICQELCSGFTRYEILRETERKFIWKTILSNAFGGGLGTIISAVPFIIIAQFSLPYTMQREQANYLSVQSYGWMGEFDTVWDGNLVIIILIILLFLFGVIWSTFALIFAGFTRNIFATMSSSFLVCFFIHIITNQTGLDAFSPLVMLDGTCSTISSWVHIAVYQGVSLVVFSVGAFFSLRYTVRRMV